MIFFDLDGTLIDSNGVWIDVDDQFLGRYGFEVTEEYRHAVGHSIFPVAAQYTKEYCKLDLTVEEIMEQWMDLARDAYHSVPLKPHVREYLDRCKAAGHRMAIFTACVPEHCRAAVAHHQLDSYFETIIYAQELGVDKKSPEIFRRVADMLGVKTGQCVLFDDSLTACKAAKAAGMTVVGVHDEYFKDSQTDMKELCDQYIRSFGDLL